MSETKHTLNLNLKGVEESIEQVIQLKQNITELQKESEQLEKEFKTAEEGSDYYKELSVKIASVKSKIQESEAAVQKFEKTGKKLNTSFIDKIKNGFSNVNKELQDVTGNTDLFSAATSALGVESELLNNVFSKFTKSASSGLDNAGKASTSFGSKLKFALASSGIGLLVIALISVYSYLTKTQEGSDLVSRKFAFLKGLVTGLSNILVGIGKEIVDFVTSIKSPADLVDAIMNNLQKRFEGFAVIWKAIRNADLEGLSNGLIQVGTGIEDATGKAKNLGKSIADAGKRAEEVERLTQNYEKLSNEIEIANKKLENQAKQFAVIGNDSTKAEADRIAAKKKQFEIEDQIDRNKLIVAQANLDLIKKTNALEDTGRAGLKAEADALQVIEDIKADIKRGDTEDAKEIAAIKRQGAAVSIAARKEELEEILAANEAALASDKLTFEEKKKIIEDTLEKRKELILQNITELDANDKSAANQKKISGLKASYTKVEADAKKELIKLEEDFNKRQETALEKINKAKIDSAKLDLQVLENGDEKIAKLKEISAAELKIITEKYEKDKLNKALTDNEKLLLEEEYALAVKSINTNLAKDLKAVDDAILADKKAAEEKATQLSADAAAKKKEIEESLKSSIKDLAQVYGDSFNAMVEANLKAIDSKIAEIDTNIAAAQERLGTLNEESAASQNNIDELQSALLTARGAEREKIIQQLEAEREKQNQIAKEKAKEDSRIKKANADKLKYEKEKEQELKKQEKVQAALTIIEATLTGLSAAKAIAEATSKGKLGWDNIAIAVAATAALLGSIAAVKNAAKAGYAEGGYTGDGGKYELAGNVHKGEYVMNQDQVRANPNIVKGLEAQRLSKSYSASINTPASSDAATLMLLAEVRKQNEYLAQNLDKPVTLNVTDVDNVKSRKTKVEAEALK